MNARFLRAALTDALPGRGAPRAARAPGARCPPPALAETCASPSATVRNCACDCFPAAPSSARQRRTRIITQVVLAASRTGRRR
jgi:hypothetical protein